MRLCARAQPGRNQSFPLEGIGLRKLHRSLCTPFNREVLNDYAVMFDRDVDDLRIKLPYVEDNPLTAQQYRQRAPERIREAYTWEHIDQEVRESKLTAKRERFCWTSPERK
jgi:hypothetical protein